MPHVELFARDNPALASQQQREFTDAVLAQATPNERATIGRWPIRWDLFDELLHGGKSEGVPGSAGTLAARDVLQRQGAFPIADAFGQYAFWSGRDWTSKVHALRLDPGLTGWNGPVGDPLMLNVQREGVRPPDAASLFAAIQSSFSGAPGPAGPAGPSGAAGPVGSAGASAQASPVGGLVLLGGIAVAAFAFKRRR